MGRIQIIDELLMDNPMKGITEHIRRLSNTGKPQEDFLLTVVTEWFGSEEFAAMKESKRYFENKADIKDKTRKVINRLGQLEDAKHLSNTRIHHPFLRRLVRQKAVYLLSNPVTVVAEKEEDKPFVEIVNRFIDKDFLRTLYILGMQAPTYKYAWLQAYYDDAGNLRFKIIPPMEVIPFWGDSGHTWLEAVARVYKIKIYNGVGEVEEKTKLEYYTNEGVWYYIVDAEGIHVDDMVYRDLPDYVYGSPLGHFRVKDTDPETGEDVMREALWGRNPFICFKYNHEEQPVLQQIKSLIDEYDMMTSNVSDMIKDVPNNVKIVKNYDGTDKQEFVYNLATYRTAFVRENGGVEQLEANIDITAADSHLNRIRRDMMEAASGVDPQETDMGGYAISGVALKFRYTDLDIDCQAMGNEFKAALERLAWFLAVDTLSKTGKDYTEAELDFIFTPVGGINEQEIIDSIVASKGVISHQTMLEKHPWVTDMQEEKRRIDEEMDSGFFTPIGMEGKSAEDQIINKSNEGNLQHRATDPVNPNAKYEKD